MRRRTLLATLGALGSGTAAGCAGFRDTRLSDPRVTTDSGETNLHFETDQRRIASLNVQHTYQPVEQRTDWGYIRLRLSLWHRESTQVDRLRYRLQQPVSATGPQANVFVESQSGEPTNIRFHQASDGRGVVFELPDPGVLGKGTMTFTFHLWPPDPQAEMAVGVGMNATLSAAGLGGYTLDARETMTVPRKR